VARRSRASRVSDVVEKHGKLQVFRKNLTILRHEKHEQRDTSSLRKTRSRASRGTSFLGFACLVMSRDSSWLFVTSENHKNDVRTRSPITRHVVLGLRVSRDVS